MLIENYLDRIQETEADFDILEYERELEVVESMLNNPGTLTDLPEDFELHPEFYSGELVDYHGQ